MYGSQTHGECYCCHRTSLLYEINNKLVCANCIDKFPIKKWGLQISELRMFQKENEELLLDEQLQFLQEIK